MTDKTVREIFCPKCDWYMVSTSPDEENLLQHLALHADQMHPGIEWSKSGLQHQMREFYGIKKLKCPKCDWSMTDPGGKENLLQHLVLHSKQCHEEEEMTEKDVERNSEIVMVQKKKN